MTKHYAMMLASLLVVGGSLRGAQFTWPSDLDGPGQCSKGSDDKWYIEEYRMAIDEPSPSLITAAMSFNLEEVERYYATANDEERQKAWTYLAKSLDNQADKLISFFFEQDMSKFLPLGEECLRYVHPTVLKPRLDRFKDRLDLDSLGPGIDTIDRLVNEARSQSYIENLQSNRSLLLHHHTQLTQAIINELHKNLPPDLAILIATFLTNIPQDQLN